MDHSQFSLKILLFWMTMLAATTACAAQGLRCKYPWAVHGWLFMSGILLGTCVGISFRRPLLGMVLGVLLWPACFVIILVLIAVDVLDAN